MKRWRHQMGLDLITGGCQDVLFMSKRILLGANRVRRTRFYCVGTGKSGTHSIAEMFSKNVRSRHEAESTEVMERVIEWRNGRLDDKAMREWLRERDQKLGLEVDSSTFNFEVLDLLLEEFPDSRFLLTIRDCYSWLNSLINHRIRFKGTANPARVKWRACRFGSDQPTVHAPEEQVLKDKGLDPLDTQLAHWASRNAQVLAKVPASRLLTVRTDQITQRAYEIADFAGLPRGTVRLQRTHSFRNPVKEELIRKLDRNFLEQKVQHHCLPLMTRFFPEIKSLDDARL
jgi:hypothetical protein